jgi:formylglycine-generating enzyme required for sulfatase activity
MARVHSVGFALFAGWLASCGWGTVDATGPSVGSPDAAAPRVPKPGDRDGDDLGDEDEARFGTGPDNPDSDEDGIPDGVEVRVHQTDPKKRDTDGDGVGDGRELGVLKTDPKTANPEFATTMEVADAQAGNAGGVPIKIARRAYEPGEALPDKMLCDKPSPDSRCFFHVPKTTYWMGAQASDPAGRNHDPAARPEEGPVHEVTVGPFLIAKFEVLAHHYALCLEAGYCDPAGHDASGYANAGRAERRQHPMNAVTWDAARRYCDYLGGRLPTEAEWELAARGAEHRPWPWGVVPHCGRALQNPGQIADPIFTDGPQAECVEDGTGESGQLRYPSPFGLLGVSGNVWEWVEDGYAADAYARHTSDRPLGPTDATSRVQRGGGWMNTDPKDRRATSRGGMRPDQKLPDVGFRCVRDLAGEAL